MADVSKRFSLSSSRSRDSSVGVDDPKLKDGRKAGSISTRPDFDTEVLSSSQFSKQLYIEKRRADRTNSKLSLVLIQPQTGATSYKASELLGQLRAAKRETDILGYLEDDLVGMLLPHTDETGADVFVSSLKKIIGHMPVYFEVGTYPDRIFDAFEGLESAQLATSVFFVDDDMSLSGGSKFAKRMLDIVGSIFAILVFSPVFLVAAIAIVSTSPGPIIFRQKRLGQKGKPFVFFKLRSMRTDADDRIHREYVASLIDGKLEEINQGDVDRPVYKMTGDPRITPVGRLIRKTSIDELPQLFNVLRGDMSLVGPRPPLLYEAEKYQSWHLRRVLQIRPGITGLWQVEGRSTTSFDEMVRLDLKYIRSQSFWLDLKILLKTVKVVLRRDGAG